MLPSPTRRLVRSKSGLRVVAQHERGNIPWHLEEPHWVKDEEVTQCMECKAKFDFVKRRHHCRRCGKIFCSRCCHSKVQFHRMGFVDPVRLCGPCADVTRRERDFFDGTCGGGGGGGGLKSLFAGAPFHVRSSVSISEDSYLYTARLSQDERSIIFEPMEEESGGGDVTGGGGEDLPPVELTRVVEVGPGRGETASSLCVRVRETATDDLQLWLDCPEEPSRKPSMIWMDAFRKGMEMVFESQSICRDDHEEGGGGGGEKSKKKS